MIGADDDIGRLVEAELDERLADAREIAVGVLDRGERRRAVDAGGELVEAIALVMLAAVRVARLEHQHERLVARLEHRQHDLGRDVDEIILLDDIGGERAGRRRIAGSAVLAA